MTQKTSAAERFTLALRAYVLAEMAYAASEPSEGHSFVRTAKDRDQMLVRLEDAFNEAVDVRVQEALTYANRSDDY